MTLTTEQLQAKFAKYDKNKTNSIETSDLEKYLEDVKISINQKVIDALKNNSEG